MENKGLLFIPDISGFTKFVSETEIGHSRLIIQELLELLINANEIGLEVSEVEGDAILFYKFGEPPELEAIYRQVEQMFTAFHRQLIAYEYRRFCQCKACTSAIGLSLKVVTHYGEFTSYNVKNFQKLIGRDVIVAHQLLKNDIEQHEYWLATSNLIQQEPPKLTGWMQWMSSTKQTENGAVPFRYTQLSQLKKEVKPESLPLPKLSSQKKIFSLTREYQANIIALFHAAGDFTYRSRWRDGVKSVEEVGHYLPRLGMRCRCVLENGESSIYASSYSFSPERIEFSETSEQDGSILYHTLEKTDEQATKLTMDYYVNRNFFGDLFRMKRRKVLQNGLQRSLINLDEVVKEIKL